LKPGAADSFTSAFTSEISVWILKNCFSVREEF
jgi:hypothetical protein